MQPASLLEPLKIDSGQEIQPPPPYECLIIRSGWIALMTILQDAQRVVGLLLPGDIIEPWVSMDLKLLALTQVSVEARALSYTPESRVLEHVARQCARLQLVGAERVKDLLVECCDRLYKVGLAAQSDFELPISRRLVGTILGMSDVHVSRIFQQLQVTKQVRIRRRRVWLSE